MRVAKTAAIFGLITLFGVFGGAWGDSSPVMRPGALGGGVTLLPNGWKITPAGRHVQVGSFPMAMVESPDGRTLFIANNGYLKPSIVAVDIKTQRVIDTLVLDHAWLGMAWHPDGKRLYVSGAGNNTVHELRWANGSLTKGADFALGPPMLSPEERADHPEAVQQNFIGGVTITPDGARLFAVHVFGQVLSVVDL